ncbi:hypothetical protein VUR80DRAFT_6310 [Thermomyces stellatus]
MKAVVLFCMLSSFTWALPHPEFPSPRAEPGFEPPTFGYDGLDGPLNWHALSENNAECALGRHQSPIALDTDVNGVSIVSGDALQLEFEDVPEGAEILNKGTTLEMSANGSLKLGLRGKEYALQQFHFHMPSEHRIEGEVFAMEAHFVFETEGEYPSVYVTGTKKIRHHHEPTVSQ